MARFWRLLILRATTQWSMSGAKQFMNKGVTITNEGDEFLAYARQVLDQASLLEEHFKEQTEINPIFSVSCQHYSFAVKAFVEVIKQFGGNEYDFTLRETQTHEIIDDVSKLKSEVGVLYMLTRL